MQTYLQASRIYANLHEQIKSSKFLDLVDISVLMKRQDILLFKKLKQWNKLMLSNSKLDHSSYKLNSTELKIIASIKRFRNLISKNLIDCAKEELQSLKQFVTNRQFLEYLNSMIGQFDVDYSNLVNIYKIFPNPNYLQIKTLLQYCFTRSKNGEFKKVTQIFRYFEMIGIIYHCNPNFISI